MENLKKSWSFTFLKGPGANFSRQRDSLNYKTKCEVLGEDAPSNFLNLIELRMAMIYLDRPDFR